MDRKPDNPGRPSSLGKPLESNMGRMILQTVKKNDTGLMMLHAGKGARKVTPMGITGK